MSDALIAKWLRPVDLQTSSGRLEAISYAATQIATSITGLQVLDLTHLAFGGVSSEAFDLLGDAVRQYDPTFGSAQDDLETRIAAAIVLRETMRGTSDVALIGAHAIQSANWLGLTPPVDSLSDSAVDALRRTSQLHRSRDNSEFAQPEPLVLPEFEDDGSAVTHEEGRQLVQAIEDMAISTKAQFADLISTFTQRLDAADEELELLWWAFSGHSETLDRRWSKVTKDGLVALAAGLEFASHVVFSVEPPSTRELLSRVLGSKSSHAVTIEESVSHAFRIVDVPDASGHQLLPLLSCLNEATAMQGKTGWKESVTRWSIDTTHASACLDVAEQIVRESLVARSLEAER